MDLSSASLCCCSVSITAASARRVQRHPEPDCTASSTGSSPGAHQQQPHHTGASMTYTRGSSGALVDVYSCGLTTGPVGISIAEKEKCIITACCPPPGAPSTHTHTLMQLGVHSWSYLRGLCGCVTRTSGVAGCPPAAVLLPLSPGPAAGHTQPVRLNMLASFSYMGTLDRS